MPILGPEICQFPADLLSAPIQQESDRQWWAVHTRPRQEKALARELVRMELPFYLPLVKKQHVLRGKTIPAMLPLFDGYIFLYVDQDERIRALSTQRVAQIVTVPNQVRLHADLRNICSLIATDAPLTIERRLAPGRRVRIRSGAMRGLEGIVVERRAQTRLLVSIDFLQQGASVAIEDCLLEPLD